MHYFYQYFNLTTHKEQYYSKYVIKPVQLHYIYGRVKSICVTLHEVPDYTKVRTLYKLTREKIDVATKELMK